MYVFDREWMGADRVEEHGGGISVMGDGNGGVNWGGGGVVHKEYRLSKRNPSDGCLLSRKWRPLLSRRWSHMGSCTVLQAMAQHRREGVRDATIEWSSIVPLQRLMYEYKSLARIRRFKTDRRRRCRLQTR